MELTLTNTDEVAIVDDDFAYPSVHKWRMMNTGYVGGYCNTLKRTILLHRAAMGTPIGRVPEYDHDNKDKLDCRRANLIDKTRSGNMFNTNNDEKGVYQLPGGRWRAVIRIDYNLKHLGVFDTREEALAARKEALDATGRYEQARWRRRRW